MNWENQARSHVESGLLEIHLKPEESYELCQVIQTRIRQISHRDIPQEIDFRLVSTLARFGCSLTRSNSLQDLSYEDVTELLKLFWSPKIREVEKELQFALAVFVLRQTGPIDPVWQDQISKEMIDILG